MTTQPVPDFACNIEAVKQTATDLSKALTALREFRGTADRHAGAVSSSLIQGALDDFYKDSSDMRGKVEQAVESLHRMMQGLADGVETVDRSLRDSLPEARQQRMAVVPGQPPPSGTP